MAQLAIHGNWRSVSALATLFVLIGMIAYASAGGLDSLPKTDAGIGVRVQYGLGLYVLCFVVIGLGFWSKEDAIAVMGITLFSLLMILDVLLRIGVLSFNTV